MRKFLILTTIALLASPGLGCNSCGRSSFRFWNRGDSCRTCADANCTDGNCQNAPGMLGSPVLTAPYTGTEALPGPATILPAPR